MATAELREFFESLGSEDDLRQLVATGQQEHLHLEFKQKGDRRGPELHERDAFHFSRALSGFANSDGGVLLWGIKTDRNERAIALKPITDCFGFQGVLKKSLLHAVQPSVDGVLVDVILSDNEESAGYVRCLIPPSDAAPHRAMLAGREYYKRSTEGFYRLEHFDLEDLFGRRPTPDLRLRATVKPTGRSFGTPMGEKVTGIVIIAIENAGRGAARAPYLVLEPKSKHQIWEYGVDGNRREGLPRIPTGSAFRHVFTSADVVIPPTIVHDVTAFDIAGYIVSSLPEQWRMPEELVIGYRLGAELGRPKEGVLTVSPAELSEGIYPNYRSRFPH
jgi:hypothetical protein